MPCYKQPLLYTHVTLRLEVSNKGVSLTCFWELSLKTKPVFIRFFPFFKHNSVIDGPRCFFSAFGLSKLFQ